MNQDVSKKRILNAAKWSSFAEIAARLATPIVNMILARLLTPDAFGVVASITIITSFADIFTDAGFQKYVIQHDYENESALNKGSNVAFTANIILAIAIYTVIFLSHKGLAKAVGCQGEELGILVASLAVFCTAIPSVANARFRRDLDFKPLFYIRVISAAIPLVFTVPLALIFKNYWALIVGTLLQKIFIAIATIILSRWKPHFCFDTHVFMKMISFSFWNLMETFSIWFAGQANIFIVGNILTAYYLGLYKTSMSAVNSCLGIITAAVTPVLFSSLSRFQNNSSEYINTFNNFQFVLGALVIPLGCGIFLFKDVAVAILLGSQWKEATFFLGLWALMSTVTIVYSNTACEVYRSLGRPKVSLFLQLVYLVIYIPSIFYSAKCSFEVLTVVSCVVRLLPVIMDIVILKVLFGFKMRSIINNTVIAILTSILMLFFGAYLRHISDDVLWQIITIVLCCVFYIVINLCIPMQRKKILGNSMFAPILKGFKK